MAADEETVYILKKGSVSCYDKMLSETAVLTVDAEIFDIETVGGQLYLLGSNRLTLWEKKRMTALVFDVIAVAVLALSVIECYKKGFVAYTYIYWYAISCIGAYFGSRMLSEAIYRLFIRDRLLPASGDRGFRRTGKRDHSPGHSGIKRHSPMVFSAGRSIFRGSRGDRGTRCDFCLSAGGASQHRGGRRDYVSFDLRVIAGSLLFGACFFCLMIVLRVLVRLLRQIRYVPLLGTVNALAGRRGRIFKRRADFVGHCRRFAFGVQSFWRKHFFCKRNGCTKQLFFPVPLSVSPL